MIRLIYAIPVWIIASPVKLVFILLGFFTVPVAALFKAYEVTEVRPVGHPKYPDGDKVNWTWGFMAPWDNWEDGIACRNYKQFDSMFLQICYWSCFRNPANGLRTWYPYSFILDKSKVGFVGSLEFKEIERYRDRFPHWYFAWHGPYTCFFWQFMIGSELRRLWIGWKLEPQDINGIKPGNYRERGVAFTMQFKRIT